MRADGFYPSRKVAEKRNRYFSELNLWPFVGVLIVLLVIMMLVSGHPTHSHGPDLAVVRHAFSLPRAVKEDAMRLSVTRDGLLYFGNSRVLAEGLSEKIHESVSNGSEKRVYVIVDARAKYGDVNCALDAVRDAGIADVSFLVENERR